MNGTDKDIERAKESFSPKTAAEKLEEALQDFLVEICPRGWTKEQTEWLTLKSLLEHAIYYADDVSFMEENSDN